MEKYSMDNAIVTNTDTINQEQDFMTDIKLEGQHEEWDIPTYKLYE